MESRQKISNVDLPSGSSIGDFTTPEVGSSQSCYSQTLYGNSTDKEKLNQTLKSQNRKPSLPFDNAQSENDLDSPQLQNSNVPHQQLPEETNCLREIKSSLWRMLCRILLESLQCSYGCKTMAANTCIPEIAINIYCASYTIRLAHFMVVVFNLMIRYLKCSASCQMAQLESAMSNDE